MMPGVQSIRTGRSGRRGLVGFRGRVAKRPWLYERVEPLILKQCSFAAICTLGLEREAGAVVYYLESDSLLEADDNDTPFYTAVLRRESGGALRFDEFMPHGTAMGEFAERIMPFVQLKPGT